VINIATWIEFSDSGDAEKQIQEILFRKS
jgi:hypothetical protein